MSSCSPADRPVPGVHIQWACQDGLCLLLQAATTRGSHQETGETLHMGTQGLPLVVVLNIKVACFRINISTERFKWCLISTNAGSTLRIASDIIKIQSSDWPKWHCVLWRYVISHLLWYKTSIQMVRQTGC